MTYYHAVMKHQSLLTDKDFPSIDVLGWLLLYKKCSDTEMSPHNFNKNLPTYTTGVVSFENDNVLSALLTDPYMYIHTQYIYNYNDLVQRLMSLWCEFWLAS